VIGTAAALIERERSSVGQLVDIHLYECLVSTLTNFASRVLGGIEALPRMGNQGPNSAPWELFTAADGKEVFIIAGSPPTFERLAHTMGRPELLQDPRFLTSHKRREHFKDITEIVQAWAQTLTQDQIIEALRANGVPVSPLNSIAETLRDPHAASRRLVKEDVDDRGRQFFAPGQPLGFGHSLAPVTDDGPSAPDFARRANESMSSGGDRRTPLAGVRVVDFGTLTAGPFCTRIFGSLGADVLKIEPSAGEAGRHSLPIVDGESVYFHITNAGKRTMSADLRDQGDVALVRKVLSNADIIVENQAPGALSRRGLGGPNLLVEAPDLVYTSVSGYGHTGLHGGLRAYDTVIQAAAGLMIMTGPEGGIALKTGISTADVLGSLAAAAGSLAALFGRLTGRHRGVHLDVALFDITMWAMQPYWVAASSGSEEVARTGNGHWSFAPYGTFLCSDGQEVAVACETDAEWRSLATELASRPEEGRTDDWVDMPVAERLQHRDRIAVLVAEYCATRTAGDVVTALQARGVPSGEVREVDDVFLRPLKGTRPTVDVTLASGRTQSVTSIPIHFRSTPMRASSAGPELRSEDGNVRTDPDRAWEQVFQPEGVFHA